MSCCSTTSNMGSRSRRKRCRDELRAAIFRAWNRYNGGIADRRGNPLREHAFNFASIEYLAKEARYREARKPSEPNWWGQAQRAIFAQTSNSVHKERSRRYNEKAIFGRDAIAARFALLHAGVTTRETGISGRLYLRPTGRMEQSKRDETRAVRHRERRRTFGISQSARGCMAKKSSVFRFTETLFDRSNSGLRPYRHFAPCRESARKKLLHPHAEHLCDCEKLLC